jgi:hypothetical protein
MTLKLSTHHPWVSVRGLGRRMMLPIRKAWRVFLARACAARCSMWSSVGMAGSSRGDPARRAAPSAARTPPAPDPALAAGGAAREWFCCLAVLSAGARAGARTCAQALRRAGLRRGCGVGVLVVARSVEAGPFSRSWSRPLIAWPGVLRGSCRGRSGTALSAGCHRRRCQARGPAEGAGRAGARRNRWLR